jgi:hypothetical protein
VTLHLHNVRDDDAAQRGHLVDADFSGRVSVLGRVKCFARRPDQLDTRFRRKHPMSRRLPTLGFHPYDLHYDPQGTIILAKNTMSFLRLETTCRVHVVKRDA